VIRNTYAENDHIALAADLRNLTRLGWKIIPLQKVVNWHRDPAAEFTTAKVLALSFDDGSWFDYYDLDHPVCGMQRSFLNILKDFMAADSGELQNDIHASSFVISSPDAREELDRKSLVGKGWWSDEWWGPAEASGLMNIECHSWDHNHPDLDRVAQQDQVKGDFYSIKTYTDCDSQVAKAGEYIRQQPGVRTTSLFAYPWGQASDYMMNQYLPEYQDRHGFIAAFATEPKPVEKSDNIWSLPRFVFGRDWTTPDGLISLLADT